MLALFNWRQRIQATGLGQIWKCQPTSVKTPLFVSQSGQKKKEKEKETGMFSYSGQGNTPLTGWFTMSPTLRTKTSLWSGNYRLSLLTLLSLSLSLCVSHSLTHPLSSQYWCSDCRLRETSRTRTSSVWLLTVKKDENVFGSRHFTALEQCGMTQICVDNRMGGCFFKIQIRWERKKKCKYTFVIIYCCSDAEKKRENRVPPRWSLVHNHFINTQINSML